MAKKKHTPTPWEAKPERLYHGGRVAGRSPTITAGDVKVATVTRQQFGRGRCSQAEANAALIVRCVNSHEDLLTACKQLLAVVDGLPEGHSAARVTAAALAKDAIKRATT